MSDRASSMIRGCAGAALMAVNPSMRQSQTPLPWRAACGRGAADIVAVTASTPLPDDIHAWARESLAADTGAQAQACDARIAQSLPAFLAPRAGPALQRLFDTAPSADVYRHLWRILARCERGGSAGLASPVRLFAIPVIVVAALDAARQESRELPGIVSDAAALRSLLVEHAALAGNRTLALAPALVDVNALDFARLPSLFASAALDAPGGVPLRPDLAPAPIDVAGPTESVHLRFLVGSALAAPGADLFGRGEVGAWAMGFTQKLSAMLAVPGTSVLALPRAPLPLVEAAWQGRVAQREVSAQLFASNALRALRARVGEPVAVVSVHRGPTGDAPAEVRLSLSSPLEPRDAQGLRCPLWPLDRPDDVVAMLATLLADCRVMDVRRKPGVHPDRDPVTGGPLLFKVDDGAPGALRH